MVPKSLVLAIYQYKRSFLFIGIYEVGVIRHGAKLKMYHMVTGDIIKQIPSIHCFSMFFMICSFHNIYACLDGAYV